MRNDKPSEPSKTMHPLAKVFLAVALAAVASKGLDLVLDDFGPILIGGGQVVESEPVEPNKKPSIQPDLSTGSRFPAPT